MLVGSLLCPPLAFLVVGHRAEPSCREENCQNPLGCAGETEARGGQSSITSHWECFPLQALLPSCPFQWHFSAELSIRHRASPAPFLWLAFIVALVAAHQHSLQWM